MNNFRRKSILNVQRNLVGVRADVEKLIADCDGKRGVKRDLKKLRQVLHEIDLADKYMDEARN